MCDHSDELFLFVSFLRLSPWKDCIDFKLSAFFYSYCSASSSSLVCGRLVHPLILKEERTLTKCYVKLWR